MNYRPVSLGRGPSLPSQFNLTIPMNPFLRLLAVAGALVPLTAVHAVTYNYTLGVVHSTDAFASFGTTGSTMTGMGVQVLFSDGSTANATWQSLGTGFGGVQAAGGNPFTLTASNTSNPSSSAPWLLFNASTSHSIVSVSLDGQPGSTVFDVSFPFGQFAGINFVGTAGTAAGLEFSLATPSGIPIYGIYEGISITYGDAVALTGAAPVGDVFRRMTIQFAPNRLLAPGALIEFAQDTDNVAFGSVLAPVTPNSSVPDAGGTLALFFAGLAGLTALRWKFRAWRLG